MDKKILLEVITPEGKIFKEEVEGIFLRAIDGELGILPNHIPIVTPLDVGILKYIKNNSPNFISLIGGFLEVKDNKASIVTEAAELGTDIEQLINKLTKLRDEASIKDADDIAITDAEYKLKQALLRLQAYELVKEIKSKKQV